MSETRESEHSSSQSSTAVIPRATYRLQLNSAFNFRMAADCVPYLSSLNISHLYLSPIFQARPGSTHGYDVTNHAAFNAEIGTAEDFSVLVAAAQSHDMGIIIDIVPNHMAVMAADNTWWLDVLENGPAANFAAYFDIDWRPARASMRDRLLLPVLGERYGTELQNGRIKVHFDRDSGSFYVGYGEHRFPVDPREYPKIFRLAKIDGAMDASTVQQANPDVNETLSSEAIDRQEFESLLDEFSRLPHRSDISTDAKLRRYRDKEVYKRRLARLCIRSPELSGRINSALHLLNGVVGDAQSFDSLAQLLEVQPYRLAFWKVAGDEINYRRFFDVNQLAALRVEEPDVFNATHKLVLELVRSGQVQGLRIDHVDGLHNPKGYLETLRTALSNNRAEVRHSYIVVEKILASHERLRDDWPVEGTTGYEFGASVVAWLIAEHGMASIDQTYRHYVRHVEDFDAIAYRSKKLIMRTSLAAEIAVLTMQLDRIAQAHPDTMDFTQFALRDALIEVIAAFPVYRTYVAADEVSVEDRQSIAWAIGAARKGARASDRSIFKFIEDVLLGAPAVTTTDAQRQAVLHFTMKFQQVTSPVMAKSVEDTSFYLYARLLALNEVGGDPRFNGISGAALHKINQDRANRWPHSLLATSTHDTKRGEDVRYRLAVLSELPKLWREHLGKWSRLNRTNRQILSTGTAPSRNDEYLLLQTLLGIWPVDRPTDTVSLGQRLKDYALKAAREAKENTSWIDPEPEYEAALQEFIDGILNGKRGEHFRAEFGGLIEVLAYFGLLNCLAATVLKCTSPGVPDFYQGSELPELVLVDPDNRQPVDYTLRRSILNEYDLEHSSNETFNQFENTWRDGRIKLWLTQTLLHLRKKHAALFSSSDYEALTVSGAQAQYVFAFARYFQGTALISVVSRWTATLMKGVIKMPLGIGHWTDTRIHLTSRLSQEQFTDQLTRRPIVVERTDTDAYIYLKNVFVQLPVAVLLSVCRQ